MRFSAVLVTITTVCFLVSCQPDLEEEILTPETAGEKRKMLVEETIYQSGNPHHKYYRIYLTDTVAHTITCLADTLTNTFDRSYYDNNGRLLKTVFNNWDELVPLSRDSVVYTRVSPGHITWKYSWDPYSFTAITTSLPGGRTQIMVTNTQDDPAVFYTKFVFNANGTLDSLKIGSNNPEVYKKEIFYNAAGMPVSVVTNSFQPQSNFIYQVNRAITKDTRENVYLLFFLNKLAGSDMGWMKYGFDAPTSLFSYELTDQLFLQGGTIQSVTTTAREIRNGVPTDTGPWDYQYPTQYDNSGRIISWAEKVNGQIESSIAIKYYD